MPFWWMEDMETCWTIYSAGVAFWKEEEDEESREIEKKRALMIYKRLKNVRRERYSTTINSLVMKKWKLKLFSRVSYQVVGRGGGWCKIQFLAISFHIIKYTFVVKEILEHFFDYYGIRFESIPSIVRSNRSWTSKRLHKPIFFVSGHTAKLSQDRNDKIRLVRQEAL